MDTEKGKVLEQAERVYAALNQVIEEGPWQNSENLLLTGIRKKLCEQRDRFTEVLAKRGSLLEMDGHRVDQEVFVLLYQAQTDDLSKWQNVLANLTESWVNRPIYRDNSAVESAMAAGDRKRHYAYAVVRVKLEDILPPPEEGPLLDRLGQRLLHLKEGAIQSEHILRFVHAHGEYQWINGYLVKQPVQSGAT